MTTYSFMDDYSEGAHPRILNALVDTNLMQQTAYGNDAYSREARDLLRGQMGGADPDIWLVASGTHANLLCIAAALRPHEAVIAPASGHIVQREAGAIEATGHKILTAPPEDGKLTPASIRAVLDANAHFPHMVKPRLVYVSNATETGTVYTRAELAALSDLCRERNLWLMVDGARLGAALASDQSDLTLADLATLADLFWIGGTKAGALLGEAIVICNPALKPDFDFHIKQRGALLAKGRVLGVQFRELFRDGLFFDLSRHANAMARTLSDGLKERGIDFAAQTESNQLFPILPDALIEGLQRDFTFYVWEPHGDAHSVTRFVTSWATDAAQVERFLDTVERLQTAGR